jgi:hypothetical protein
LLGRARRSKTTVGEAAGYRHFGTPPIVVSVPLLDAASLAGDRDVAVPQRLADTGDPTTVELRMPRVEMWARMQQQWIRARPTQREFNVDARTAAAFTANIA